MWIMLACLCRRWAHQIGMSSNQQGTRPSAAAAIPAEAGPLAVRSSTAGRPGSGPTDGAGRCADVEGIGLLESSGAPSPSRECAVLCGLLNFLGLFSSSSRL